MKHFLIEIVYTVPTELFEEVVPAHRAYLQTGYETGMILCSGPKEPRIGGIVLARAKSLEEIEAFFQNDPFALEKVATHRFVEFDPVKFQPVLSSWVTAD